MKTFKLSQSKDDSLLKITSKKTNYEIKLTDNELSELRTELGFNDVKNEPKEVENEKSIDWEKLSFPEWFYQTSKLEFACYEDLRAHYMSDETSIDNVHKIRLFIEKVNPIINSTNTERLYEILTNPKILKVGEVVKIGEYKFSVDILEERKTFFLKSKKYNNTFKLFEKFGITRHDIHSRFETAEDKDVIFPETKTLKELTKIYYYLKTFEV